MYSGYITLPEMVGFFIDLNASISSNPHLTKRKKGPREKP
jgi:hypothetical protein